MIRKYLERNGDIKFEKDFVDGVEVTRIKCSDDFWMNKMNFLEWFLIAVLDRCTGFYGYRRTICCSEKNNCGCLNEPKDYHIKNLTTGKELMSCQYCLTLMCKQGHLVEII